MLSLTRKTDYALVALSYLAGRRADGDQPASAKQIAGRFGLPQPLLMNILKELVRAKVLRSTRGASGGYELAVEPGRVTLLEVVTAMDGPIRLAHCADGLPIVGQGCTLSQDCPIQGPIRSLHGRINRFLEETTLEDLVPSGPGPADTHRRGGTANGDAVAACGCRETQEATRPQARPAGAKIYQGA
jgi:Rrf2 family protein